ncbi:amidohydrolase family protein [Chloroflexi bacterium TSY]|nr:amidohydrolase family protein [Chloroflexi bacterium TSY]
MSGLIIWLLVWAILKLTGKKVQFRQTRHYILPSLVVLLLMGGLAAWLKIVPLNAYVSLSYPFPTVPETGAEARRFVREIKAAGYDFIKPYDYLSEEAYLATLDEARQQNMYTVGHPLDELSQELETMFSGGLREVAHVDEFIDSHMIGEASPTGFNEVEFNYETIPQTADIAKAHDVMVVSNMVTDETVYKILEDVQGGLAQPEYAIVPPDVMDDWKTQGRFVNWQGQQGWRRNVLQPFLMTMTKALHDAGVPLLIGTDISVEGMVPAHIHRELELLVETGLTPFEAIEAGTKNAGISVTRMGHDGRFGTVEVGQRADLILLKQNPLENVSHTRNRVGVMARGQWFTQAELDALVDEYVGTYRTDDTVVSK